MLSTIFEKYCSMPLGPFEEEGPQSTQLQSMLQPTHFGIRTVNNFQPESLTIRTGNMRESLWGPYVQ